MPFFSKSPRTEELPAQKRISSPASQRLTTITEGGGSADIDAAPPIPRRSSRRNSGGAAHSLSHSKRWSGSTERTAPPPYEQYHWVAEPDDNASTVPNPADDEKLARLRRGEDPDYNKRRGGWRRLALIVGIVLIVVIALAIGLGVGLTRKTSSGGDNNQQSPSSPSNSPPQKFPLGEYSMITALKDIEYGCTSNQATWRCWPYTLYSPSTNTSSLASFNWIISNTSTTYATASSSSTPSGGVPANLTVNSAADPFGITFTNKPLTYISASSNSTSARLTFSFSMTKMVVPAAAITTDNTNAKCFFNSTTFTGTIYLSSPRNYPVGEMHDSSLGGYQQWPYAVEITQIAGGGTDVPNCYETNNGKIGAPITYGITPMPSTADCVCGYRNF